MTDVCIGIPVRERPELLALTLASLEKFSPDVPIVLLGDGPDAAASCALRAASGVRVLSWPRPSGAPHCFNRLVAERRADCYLLLENGAEVAPGWLSHLLAALAADATYGLAGPSTNRAWNEQSVFRECGSSQADLVRVAEEAAARFGDAHASLEPLHSLAEFCYLVRREVIERIGAADEGYGRGPCWEMAYNIRAARAGFRGIWAKAAFVRRALPSESQVALEARLFPASKRRYQDQYCALRLRRQTAGYDTHCTGDACSHFAPPELIRLRREFPASLARNAPTRSEGPPPEPPASESREKSPRGALPEDHASIWGTEPPLVSCIVPTRDRRQFLAMAAALFMRQSYPRRELIVIDDARESAQDVLPPDPRIRYVHVAREMTLGDKRNLGCELAQGDFVMHWDDDDWYGAERIAAQVAPLVRDVTDVSALTMPLVMELPALRFWRCRTWHHARIHYRDLCPGTLTFRRSLWLRGARYAAVRCGEDVEFMKSLPAATRVLRLAGEPHFVCVRHVSNTWSLPDWRSKPSGWQRSSKPLFMSAEDLSAYAAISRRLNPSQKISEVP
ncbi:MAG TPA: glycosyltransferase [Polyangiaceae bacterium]|nr:glycosyltransferase [Polyangiaceae bacterium]